MTDGSTVELWDGWSLRLPTPCQTTRNDDGSWSAWDEHHVVDLSIIEVGGMQGGGDVSPTEMLGEAASLPQHQLDGAIVTISSDTETTDTADGPQPITWTRVNAAAPNTALMMSVGNTGESDVTWHEALWRSIRYQPPSRGRLASVVGDVAAARQ